MPHSFRSNENLRIVANLDGIICRRQGAGDLQTKHYKVKMQRQREAEERYREEMRRYRAQYPSAGNNTGH